MSHRSSLITQHSTLTDTGLTVHCSFRAFLNPSNSTRNIYLKSNATVPRLRSLTVSALPVSHPRSYMRYYTSASRYGSKRVVHCTSSQIFMPGWCHIIVQAGIQSVAKANAKLNLSLCWLVPEWWYAIIFGKISLRWKRFQRLISFRSVQLCLRRDCHRSMANTDASVGARPRTLYRWAHLDLLSCSKLYVWSQHSCTSSRSAWSKPSLISKSDWTSSLSSSLDMPYPVGQLQWWCSRWVLSFLSSRISHNGNPPRRHGDTSLWCKPSNLRRTLSSGTTWRLRLALCSSARSWQQWLLVQCNSPCKLGRLSYENVWVDMR